MFRNRMCFPSHTDCGLTSDYRETRIITDHGLNLAQRHLGGIIYLFRFSLFSKAPEIICFLRFLTIFEIFKKTAI